MIVARAGLIGRLAAVGARRQADAAFEIAVVGVSEWRRGYELEEDDETQQQGARWVAPFAEI